MAAHRHRCAVDLGWAVRGERCAEDRCGRDAHHSREPRGDRLARPPLQTNLRCRPGRRRLRLASRPMRSTRTVLSGVALMTLVSAAAAKAAPTLQIHGGVYAAKETLVEQNKSAAVNAIVVDHGRRVRNVGVACNSGPAPGQGIMSDTTLTVHIPGSLTITHSGSFSYSGTVTLTSEDTQSGVSATSAVSDRKSTRL